MLTLHFSIYIFRFVIFEYAGALYLRPDMKRIATVWGRAPVWGSEFTSKHATIYGGSSRNRCWTEREFVRFGAWWWWRDPRSLEQPEPTETSAPRGVAAPKILPRDFL
jgi:hypothetical protein